MLVRKLKRHQVVLTGTGQASTRPGVPPYHVLSRPETQGTIEPNYFSEHTLDSHSCETRIRSKRFGNSMLDSPVQLNCAWGWGGEKEGRHLYTLSLNYFYAPQI